MGFLPIIYAGFFLFIATSLYVCFSVVGGLDAVGKRLFAAVLAFGAWSAIGYIFAAIVVSTMHFESVAEQQSQLVFFSLVYVVPGLLGSWFTDFILGVLKRKKKTVAPRESA